MDRIKSIFKSTGNRILKVIKRAWNKLSAVRIKLVDIAVLLGVVILSCLVIVPSIFQCAQNRDKAACEYHMYKMLGVLSEALGSEAENGGSYWRDMIMNGNYQKLLRAINDKTGESWKYPSSDYYIRTGDNMISIICKRHKDVSEKEFRFSNVQNVNVDIAEKPMLSAKIAYLTVSGPDTYYQNSSLDEENPEKMVFSGSEVDGVIHDLKVCAVYVGGYREELQRSKYTIITDSLDMSKPGQTTLIIKYNSTSTWDNSAYVPFVIDVVGEEEAMPLIVDAGINGKFMLDTCEWHDFAAVAEEKGSAYGASIVRYKGKYYYYPDGFYVVSGHRNSDPFEYAVDIDDWSRSAYYIEIDAGSVILNKRDEKKIRNGSLKAENDAVYIWQDKPSKEFPEGWIRVYCELTKI